MTARHMRAYREAATIFLKPKPTGTLRHAWCEVEFRGQRELEEAVAAEAALLWPGHDVVADASTLGQWRKTGVAPGQILVDGHVAAIWGITSRRPAPTHSPPTTGAAGDLLDEPQAPHTPPPPPGWGPPPPEGRRP